MVLDPVRYELDVEGGDAGWRLRRFHLEERLSSPYLARVDLQHPSLHTDLEALLGASCTVTLYRGLGAVRRLCGVISHVSFLGIEGELVLAKAEIVPALELLKQTQNSRIFQEKTAIEVACAVLRQGLSPYERDVRLELLRQSYARRDYCVQYRESDFAFASRLLDEEGVGYYFDHTSAVEQLVLFDDNQVLPRCELDGGRVRLASPGAAPDEEIVQALRPSRSMRPTSSIVREYEWQWPGRAAQHEAHGRDVGPCERVIYDAAPALCLTMAGNDGRERVRLYNERERQESSAADGEANVIGFEPGRIFEICDHGTSELAGNYILTVVTHDGVAASAHAGGEVTESEYHNSFACIPESLPHRPRRYVPRPCVSTATATVVGPENEEVHTDEHGRIKVRFHWDRESAGDEHSSCWIRVMQTWAGSGFGTLFLPRVGMEVVVQFLEGNIDRPLVIGCVYNGANTAPVALPGEKTKSGIFTRSSPSSMGYNELVFEDAAGKEEISLHAQKDLRTKVLHDEDVDVGNNDTLHVGVDRTVEIGSNEATTIGVDRTVEIGSNEATTIGADRSLTVGASETLSIGADRQDSVGGQETLTVTGDRTRSVGGSESINVGGSRTLEVSGSDSLKIGGKQSIKVGSIKNETVGGLSLENIGGAKTLSVGGAYAVSVGGAMNTTVGGASFEQVGFLKVVKAGSKLELCCGESKITLEKSGKITIVGKELVKIEAGLIDLN